MKRLDRVQEQVLIHLTTTCGGMWDCTTAWQWSSAVKTEKVLAGLVSRGLVDKTGTKQNFGIFEVTKAGERYVEEALEPA